MEKHRFSVTYSIDAKDETEARHKAFDICVEQTVEFPYELITDGFIREEVVGRLETFSGGENRYYAEISYHDNTAGKEFTQFLNVLFGNTSIKPGIRIEKIRLSHHLLLHFKGPRFGVQGIRKITGVYHRPLICSAIKPMGQTPKELAELAYKFTLGCVDIVKDDHGLSDQPFAPFKQRVKRVSSAIALARKKSGSKTIYAPNVTADTTDEVLSRALYARNAGAGALLISGSLTGLGTVRALSRDKRIKLPVLFHPAFMGSFTSTPHSGISHYALYGQIVRMAGADITIFPNFGGRFSFSEYDCRMIAQGCRDHMGDIAPIMPGPGGGMSLETVGQMKEFYGNDAVFLIGGGLFKSGDVEESCRVFKEKIK